MSNPSPAIKWTAEQARVWSKKGLEAQRRRKALREMFHNQDPGTGLPSPQSFAGQVQAALVLVLQELTAARCSAEDRLTLARTLRELQLTWHLASGTPLPGTARGKGKSRRSYGPDLGSELKLAPEPEPVQDQSTTTGSG